MQVVRKTDEIAVLAKAAKMMSTIKNHPEGALIEQTPTRFYPTLRKERLSNKKSFIPLSAKT